MSSKTVSQDWYSRPDFYELQLKNKKIVVYLLILHIRLIFFTPSLTLHNVKIYSAKPNKQAIESSHNGYKAQNLFFFFFYFIHSITTYDFFRFVFGAQPSIQNSSLWTLFNTSRCVSNNKVSSRCRKIFTPIEKNHSEWTNINHHAVGCNRCAALYTAHLWIWGDETFINW